MQRVLRSCPQGANGWRRPAGAGLRQRAGDSPGGAGPASVGQQRRAAAPRTVRARAASAEVEEGFDAADNFYYILGVPPRATTKEIRDAYRALMKDVHPDLSGDEDSTEFAALLNEVYKTLVDPERRATYDAVAGFAAESINPFVDDSFPADAVFVDEFTCIGCRNCCHVCPSSFQIEEDWGRARVSKQGADGEEKLQEAIDTCPVSCIHWVTTPQLSLLEAAMEKMERVAVWALMSNNMGGGKDVFTEASIAWEKRQAAVRQRLQEEQSESARRQWAWAAGFDGFPGAAAGANFYSQAQEASRRRGRSGASSAAGSRDGYESSDGGGYESSDDFAGGGSRDGGGGDGGGRDRERVAALAARAARAARRYKEWSEANARRSRALLAAPAAAAAPAPVGGRGGGGGGGSE